MTDQLNGRAASWPDGATAGPYTGIVFDLDGVLTDTEHLWEENWTGFSGRHDREWAPANTEAMMGMSMPETARYLRDHTASPDDPEAIAVALTDWMIEALRTGRAEINPGAADLVVAVAARSPVALASSAPRRLIDAVLEATGLLPYFTATVSSEEVPRGKPDPGVYLEAARRLRREPTHCLGIEDSSNGIKSALAAGLTVIALPNKLYPPKPELLEQCAAVAASLPDVQRELLARLAHAPAR